MSLFTGIVMRKGGTISQNDLDSLTSTIKHIPHKSYKDLIHENVAFSSFHTKSSELPLYCDKENLLFVAQGRIDNREELRQRLNIETDDFVNVSDESLILQAYLQYGDETPNFLLGDWTFAAYYFHTNTLFLAQNPCGYSSLYYYIDSETIVFSNLIKPLLASKEVSKEIDLQKIVGLSAIIPGLAKDTTFYKSIKLLNPAHRMWVDENTHRKERYWFPERLPLNHDITAADAAEKLRELFTEAVRCRLRSDKPIASMLSGGLDSGSVASIAANLLKEKETQLHTFSHIPRFDIDDDAIGDNYFGDERPYIESTVKHNGNIEPHYLDSKEMTPLQGIRIHMDIVERPIHAASNAYWLVDLFTQVKEANFGTLLSGVMGNATISLKGQKHLLKKRDEFILKDKVLRPLYRCYVKPLYKSVFQRNGWKEYSYLHPEFAKKIKLEQQIKESGRSVDFSTQFTHREYQERLHLFGYNPRFSGGSSASHYFGVEQRDPTGDKRVVEFMMQLPNELFFSNTDEGQHIIKLMMKDILPDKVLFQTKKGMQSADIIERVQPDIPEIEDMIINFSTDICEDELFDRRRMLLDLKLLQRKKLTINLTTALLKTIGIMEFLNRNKNIK